MHNSVFLLAPANHPKVSIFAQGHGWPSTLLCLSLCSLWSLRQVKLSLFLQLHPHWHFLPGSSGSFCLSATPGHQSLIDTCHTCSKDLGEMQATVSIPLSPPLRVWVAKAYSSLWWFKVSECVYFYGLVSIAYTSKLSILACPLKSHDH